MIGPNEVHLWQSSLHTIPERLGCFRKVLGAEELSRSERLRTEEARQSFIVARGIARYLLGRYLARPPEAILIGYGEHGKPEVPGLHFSISHSGQVALFAFAAACAVGVDVEELRSLPNQDQLAERFFAPVEAAALRDAAPDIRELAFFNCWTRKEAYVKALGHGLGIALNEFQVSFAPQEDPRIIHIGGKASSASEWHVHAVNPKPGYVGALVYQSSWPLQLCFRRFPEDFYSDPDDST